LLQNDNEMIISPYFLDISPQDAANPRAPYALLPLPYERTVSFGSGTSRGPDAMIRASHEVELFDEELLIPMDLAVQTLPAPDFQKLDDASALSLIGKTAAPHYKSGRFVLAVGGEHTVTAPLVEAAVESFGTLGVLHLDAHLDLRDEFRGSVLSHACVLHKITKMGIPAVHAGIRSYSTMEFEKITLEKRPVFHARDFQTRPIQPLYDEICRLLPPRVYLTVDIDVLDPSLVPGTGTPEPGGLDWYNLTGLLRTLFRTKTVVSADIVELSPVAGSQVSEFIAARLGAKILTYHRHSASL
jgi:agmatinase